MAVKFSIFSESELEKQPSRIQHSWLRAGLFKTQNCKMSLVSPNGTPVSLIITELQVVSFQFVVWVTTIISWVKCSRLLVINFGTCVYNHGVATGNFPSFQWWQYRHLQSHTSCCQWSQRQTSNRWKRSQLPITTIQGEPNFHYTLFSW